MNYRLLGRTGWNISTISFGAWAIGGTWGEVDDVQSLQALRTALEQGVNFFDTADVYGDGRSERLLAKLRKQTDRPFYVATKTGRRLNPHIADAYSPENLEPFIDRSLQNLEVEALDLVQLHCPPTDVYYRPEIFDFLDLLIQKGKIRHWGVSVERVEEALKAIDYPGCQSVQIIFNMFRHRPADLFLAQAKEKQVGVLARLPLSSGMLTGKMKSSSTFEPDDHRNFNREGAAFDKGETFSGVPFEVGLEAVEQLRKILPPETSLTQFALRWILMFEGVTAAIPGAKSREQALQNCAAADLPALSKRTMDAAQDIYDQRIRPYVDGRW